MWIHLVALGLISGASSGAVQPDVQQFIHYAEKGSNSSATARKRWADKQQPLDAQAKTATEQPDATAALQALEAALKPAQQQTDAIKRSSAAASKALAQQQLLETFRQALIDEQNTTQLLFEQDDDDAIVALLLSI